MKIFRKSKSISSFSWKIKRASTFILSRFGLWLWLGFFGSWLMQFHVVISIPKDRKNVVIHFARFWFLFLFSKKKKNKKKKKKNLIFCLWTKFESFVTKQTWIELFGSCEPWNTPNVKSLLPEGDLFKRRGTFWEVHFSKTFYDTQKQKHLASSTFFDFFQFFFFVLWDFWFLFLEWLMKGCQVWIFPFFFGYEWYSWYFVDIEEAFQVAKADIQFLSKIGKGSFGNVYRVSSHVLRWFKRVF